MWIPLQPDGLSIRRLPITTFVVLGIMLLGQIGVTFFPQTKLRKSLQDLVGFSNAHPNLTIHPEVKSLIIANGGSVMSPPAGKMEPKPPGQTQMQMNLAMLTFLSSWHGHPLHKLGFQSPFKPKFTILTYAFVSGSFLLFLWNFFLLYMAGPVIEDRWGRVYYPIFLGACIAIGALGHSLHAGIGAVPLVGASSLVAGVLGAYAVILDDHRIPIKQLISRYDMEYKVPAWSIFLVWLVGTGILMMLTGLITKLVSASWPSILYPFVFGLLTAGLIRGQKLEKKLYRSPFDRLEKDQQFLVRIDKELRIGSPKKALAIMWEACRAYPDRLDFLQPCWDQAIRTGQLEGIDGLGKSLLNHYFRERDFDHAWYLLSEIDKNDIPITFPPEKLYEWAEMFFLAGRGPEAGHLLLKHAHPIPNHGAIRDQILQLTTDSDPASAIQLVERWKNASEASQEDQQVLSHMQIQLEREFANKQPDKVEAIPILPPIPFAAENEDPFASTRMAAIKLIAIQPIALHKTSMSIRMPSGVKKTLSFAKIQALSGSQLRHISGDLHCILDIHLDDPFEVKAQHVILRIHSHRIQEQDPLGQRLAKGQEAFIKLGLWLTKEDPRLLPGFDLFAQSSLPEYPSILAFEKDVYGKVSGDHYL